MAEEIKKRLFVFEDIALLDDASTAALVEAAPVADMVLALKTVEPKLRERVLAAAARTHGAGLRDEYDALGNVRLRDVEAAQQRVVAVVRRLEEEGAATVERHDELT